MNILKSGKSRSAMVAALLFAIATPVLADNDDGWFWGKGFMGHWFRGGSSKPERKNKDEVVGLHDGGVCHL